MFSRRILIDIAVAAFLALTLLCFVLSEQFPARRRLFLTLMYICVGLGVLTKGPVAAAVPALVFLAYLAVNRELGRLREMMIPAGTLIALAVAAPWYIALYAQHGWTHITSFFIGENLGRFTETVGVQARAPWFYLPVVLSDALPWSLCLPAVVAAWIGERDRTDRPHRLRTLLLLWIAIIVVVFSLSQTKQDLYIFPIVVAVAALGGDWLARVSDVGPAVPPASGRRWLTGTLITLAVVLAALGSFVLYVFGPSQSVYRVDGSAAIGALGAGGGVLVAVLTWRRAYASAITTVVAIFVAFNWLLALRALPAFEQYKPVVPLSQVIQREAKADDVVAHFDVALPSMVYYLRRHVDVMLDEAAFVEQLRANRTVFAVLPANRYADLREAFGVPTCVIARHPTSDIRLRSVLRMEPPPEVLLITNRCDGASASAGGRLDR
jgi:4-amino-4-deoxy-L-arabinose transferase-like glycosyltransferase